MSRGKVTDTELQAGQFVVPRHGSVVTEQPEDSRYLNNYKETMDQVHVSSNTLAIRLLTEVVLRP